MNIVYIAPFAFSPKATVSARMLPMATALMRRGHRVTILMPPYDNPPDSGRRWHTDGVQLENMRVNSRAPHAVTYFALARQLAARTRELQPEAIHVFKPVGPGALAMWLLWRNHDHARDLAARAITPCPILVDNDDWEGHGGWLDVNPYSPLQKIVMAWQERWCLRQACAVTCASELLVERTADFRRTTEHNARPSRPAPSTHSSLLNPLLLLPNGPDNGLREQVANAQSRRAELRKEFGWGDEPVLIYAGTVPLNHDMDLAVHAVRDALAQHPKLRWVIVATGDGLPSLRAAIHQAGIAQCVQEHGFMPHARLVEYLVAADIALYPYRDSNINRAKCSGKVIDYMACAKPMVVSDVGMNRVYLEHGRSGMLTPPGDAASFSQALQSLLTNPAQAAEIGRSAQQRLWQSFNWDDRSAALEIAYTRLAHCKPSQPEPVEG
jgi:glycosyltransferase involved in cell wall biosynthesis